MSVGRRREYHVAAGAVAVLGTGVVLQVVHVGLGQHQGRAVPDIVALQSAGYVIDVQLGARPPLREVVRYEESQIIGVIESLGIKVVG